jgi:hypothetical protein
MGGRFFAPLMLFTILLLVAAPALLATNARALRVFTIAIATAGALASFFDALPAPAPVLVAGAAIALLVPFAIPGAENPARAALALAAAMCGGWLLVLAGSQAGGARADVQPDSSKPSTRVLVRTPDPGAWGVRETFARAHPGLLPRLERHGAEFVYVLDE